MSFAALSYITLMLMPAPDMGVLQPSHAARSINTQVSEPLPQKWMSSFEEARKLAAQNQMPLLLHFDATWCGACRRMEKEVLGKPAVREMLGTQVIGCRIDADERPDLISKFGISTLPTEVVVNADGQRSGRFTGYVGLSQYTSRLRSIGSRNKEALAKARLEDKARSDTSGDNKTRSCLLVHHDGAMVGLGGFSPVAMAEARQWKKGTEEFVASHDEVTYFFQNAQERDQFRRNPDRYIPRLHGCDPVALLRENRATPGAIEYGSFYGGKLFFFASLQNRDRFENNPGWYSRVRADARTARDDASRFLSDEAISN